MSAVYIRGVEMTQVFNRSPEGLQLLWMEIEVIIWEKGEDRKVIAHGTISSRRPDRNRTGTSVIDGMMVSLGQTWWQKRVRYLAGGMTLYKDGQYCQMK
jgi:hypothetical protein